MSKITYSYAVVCNLFGGYWVGKSKNEPDGKKYFVTHGEAVDKAMCLFEEKHCESDFDPDDEDADFDILEEYEIIQGYDGDIEEIKGSIEQFVV